MERPVDHRVADRHFELTRRLIGREGAFEWILGDRLGRLRDAVLASKPNVIGEHAEKDVGADPIGQVMIDGADLEVDGLVAAKRLLDSRDRLAPKLYR